jgi:hypothetical protein
MQVQERAQRQWYQPGWALPLSYQILSGGGAVAGTGAAAIPAWVLPLSSQMLSGAGAGAGTGAALPANTMTASTIRNSAACPRNSTL